MAPKSRLRLPPPELVDNLISRWPRLNLVERGEEAQRIVALGFSRRALANALDCSEGVIRRYLQLASLPASTRAALAAGASAKYVLMLKHQAQPLPELDSDQQQRVNENRIIRCCLEEVRPWLNRHLPWARCAEKIVGLMKQDRAGSGLLGSA
jgi:hypothetical protein